MSLTEARFHDLVDATQQALEDISTRVAWMWIWKILPAC